jgi:putative zinc finger/helix-turn-helix YgiT family protein
MKNLEICPVCCSGSLHGYNFKREIKHQHIRLVVDSFEASKCDACESVVSTHEQTKHNKIININFQRAVDGLLSTHEIIRIRKKLSLNQRDASRIIGGGGMAFSKYENGSVRQSIAVDNLLKTLDKFPDLLSTLSAIDEQRTALKAFTSDIYLSTSPPQNEAKEAGLSFFQALVSVAQTVFRPIFDDHQPQQQQKTGHQNSNFIGWNL